MSLKVIFINGNIGAGKETMLQYLDESLTNRGIKGVLHPRPVFGLFLHFSQKLQHIGNK